MSGPLPRGGRGVEDRTRCQRSGENSAGTTKPVSFMPSGSKMRSRMNAPSDEPVARSIAYSPLVKTALYGGDPNFGRILQAAGQAWPPGDAFVADLEIEGVQVVSGGDAIETDLSKLAPLVQGSEIEYTLTIPGSGGETEVYFSDLSPEYVRFNSEYTS